jgi:hypothetical protein
VLPRKNGKEAEVNNSKRNLKSAKTQAQQDYKQACEFIRGLLKDGQFVTLGEIEQYCGVSSRVASAAWCSVMDGSLECAQFVITHLESEG